MLPLPVRTLDMIKNPFMTLELGAGPKTPDEFRQAFAAKGYIIDPGANQMLNSPAFSVTTKESTVDLCVAMPKNFGDTSICGPERDQMHQAGHEYNLGVCLFDTALEMCLQHGESHLEKRLLGMAGLHVAMEAVKVAESDDTPTAFRIRRDDLGKLHLTTDYMRNVKTFSITTRFVFLDQLPS